MTTETTAGPDAPEPNWLAAAYERIVAEDALYLLLDRLAMEGGLDPWEGRVAYREFMVRVQPHMTGFLVAGLTAAWTLRGRVQ